MSNKGSIEVRILFITGQIFSSHVFLWENFLLTLHKKYYLERKTGIKYGYSKKLDQYNFLIIAS